MAWSRVVLEPDLLVVLNDQLDIIGPMWQAGIRLQPPGEAVVIPLPESTYVAPKMARYSHNRRTASVRVRA